MTYILGIDPGNVESAWAGIKPGDCQPYDIGKATNDRVREMLRTIIRIRPDVHVAIEMVACYGMPVGAEVFETCVEIGRFVEICPTAQLVYRREIKLHHCQSARANDAAIRQALIDRFGNKGTKKQPGWFYGFKADIWAAYALAVYVAD